MDDQLIFVHEPAANELAGEVRSSHVEIPAELGAKVVEHVCNVAADEAAVVIDTVEARREDDLGHRLPDSRELAHRIGRRWVVLPGRPVAGHQPAHGSPIILSQRVRPSATA